MKIHGMKVFLLSFAVWAIVVSRPTASADTPLGCNNLSRLLTDVKAITASNWDDIGEVQLQSIWHSELGGIDCNAGACKTLGRRDRVIKDECQCCELFNFTIERDIGGKVKRQHLESIVIYRSAGTRQELLRDAKALASAMGLKESDAATIARGNQYDFNWVVEGAEGRRVELLDLRISRRESVWTGYFLLSRHAL